MAHTFETSEILKNVVGVKTNGTGAMLHTKDPSAPDDESPEGHYFYNPKGVVLTLDRGAHNIASMRVGPTHSASNVALIDSPQSPMTCLVTKLRDPEARTSQTRVFCKSDSKSLSLDTALFGGSGHMGLLRSIDFKDEDQIIANLYNDWHIDINEPLEERHRVVQSPSEAQQEENERKLARMGYIAEVVKQQLSEATILRIHEEARHNVDDLPDVLYRKVNSDYLINCLIHGGCINSSGLNSWEDKWIRGTYTADVDEDPNRPPVLSFSEHYLDSCDLYTPKHRKEVTMVMKKPQSACGIRMKYYPQYASGAPVEDESTLYAMNVVDHIEHTCPECACIDEKFVRGHAQSSAWQSEDEIVATQCDSGRFYFEPEDVLYLVVETQCGVDFDEIKGKLEEEGLTEYLPKLIPYEEFKENTNLK
ncbi:MAG: hypothetical protein WCR85_00330 [Sphaerochaeta sp.]